MPDKINLCDTCVYEFDTCEGEITDINRPKKLVLACNGYVKEGEKLEPVTEPEPEEQKETREAEEKLDAQRETEAPKEIEYGLCGSCAGSLVTIPINSRVRAVICNNPRCKLFRERVRTFSIPKPIPPLKKGEYWCTRCDSPHRETSKQGVRHLKYRKEVKGADNS